VFPPGSLSDRAFPLRTDITCDFRIWTKGMRSGNGAGTAADKAAWDERIKSGKFGVQDLRKLVDIEPPSWY